VEQCVLTMKGRGWRTSRGSLGIWLPAPRLLVSRIAGHGEGEFVSPIIEAFEQTLAAEGPVKLYFEVAKMNNYDSLLRTRLTARFGQSRPRVGTIAVLVSSRIVAMGVSVANLALGGLVTSYAARAPFSEALDGELRAAGILSFSSKVLLAA